MRMPVCKAGTFYEKSEIVKNMRDNVGIQQVKDMDLQPADEAVLVICKMSRI